MFEIFSYIQKHQRHVTSFVKAPPTRGPIPDMRPKRLTTMAINNGLVFRSQIYVSMPNAPWSSPAAPNPAIARPTMNADDEGAVAQTTDPTVEVNRL